MNSLSDLLQPFYGYVGLGMFNDANDELENLPHELKAHPAVLLARLELLVEMERWEDGVVLGQSLCGLWPEEHEFWFKAAYCLHELKRTQEAKTMLLYGPPALRDTALFHYNLACYESQLGNVDVAKELLKTCIEKDKAYRMMSLSDPDLEPLWDSLGKLSNE